METAKNLKVLALSLLVNIGGTSLTTPPIASLPVNPAPVSTEISVAQKIERPQKRIVLTVTAYTSRVEETDSTPFTTAAGTQVRDGVVATNALPLYTKVRIPELFGDKVFVVEDRMNKRYNNRLDIWFSELAAARTFGLRKAYIEVL